jgi:TRAP-type C4-dicarboxylate transport system substrate-binding protein
VMSEDLFNSMPEAYQDAVLKASRNAVEYGLEELDQAAEQACEELREEGTEFSSFSSDEVESWQNEAGLAEEWVQSGDEGAESVLEDYRSFIEDAAAESDYTDPLIACMEID